VFEPLKVKKIVAIFPLKAVSFEMWTLEVVYGNGLELGIVPKYRRCTGSAIIT
jgi:hypothetical protein